MLTGVNQLIESLPLLIFSLNDVQITVTYEISK